MIFCALCFFDFEEALGYFQIESFDQIPKFTPVDNVEEDI